MSNGSGYGGSGSLFGGGWNWGGGETRAHSEATADAIANGSGTNEAHYSQGYVDSRVALDKAITGSLMGAYVEMAAGQKTLSFGIDFDFYLGIDNGPFAGHTLVAASWIGGTGVISFGRGANVSFGYAENPGDVEGIYFSAGRTTGLAASIGIESGFYNGKIDGPTTTFTLGKDLLSVGIIKGEHWYNWGIVVAASFGFPFEGTVSSNATWFWSFSENKKE